MAKDLFKATSKPKKELTRISIDDTDFFNDIKQYNSIQEDMKNLKKDSDFIFSELKEISKEKWIDLYNETSDNPGSIVLESTVEGETAELTFVPSDRYIKINEKSAKALREKYDDDIVEEDITFSIDNKMAKKYGKVISQLILKSNDIEEEDKRKIIKAEKSYSVKKGTIDSMYEYGDVSEVFDSIKPVVSVKNVSLIKS